MIKRITPKNSRTKSALKDTFEALASFIFVSICCAYIWNAQSIEVWIYESIFNTSYPYTLSNDGQLRSRKVFAILLFAFSTFSHGLYLIFKFPDLLYKIRAKRSSKGQWYDTHTLTKKDLYDDEEENKN